jgi:mannose-6-phosphate isomerase-like protein (cupin superfamily)
MNKFIYGWMALIILSFGSCVTAFAEEPGSAHIESPDHYELLLENERVLVLKMVLQPGEADLAHHHQNETVYFQKGGTLLITEDNGKSFEANVPDGHVMWHQAWSHQVTNVGDTEVVAIIVEER